MDGETTFVKDIGTKDDVISTVFVEQVSDFWINRDVAIELSEGKFW